MALIDFTTYAEVRAVLGVSATELPDSVISQPQWALTLQLALEDVSLNLPTLYTTVSAIPSVSRTSTQQRFYDLVRLFASYSVAKDLLTSLPPFSVQRLADGRAEFNRFADAFKDVKEGVLGMFQNLRLRLAKQYQVLAPADTVYTQVTEVWTDSATLGTDPVTATS
jgi:hypothetical protein